MAELEVAVDLRAEVDELHHFLTTLDPEDWARPTAFKQWTPWDVVAHLHLSDCFGLASLEGREALEAKSQAFLGDVRGGGNQRDFGREYFAGLPPAELLARWIESARELATRLAGCDPKRRLAWFGPDMGARMFATARLMETWAHGQEVYDLMGVQRAATDRLRHIATIGVRTFAWAFANRGLDVPTPAPKVSLRAPSGALWSFNDDSRDEWVSGDALDFCQVVTQTRNVADTSLEVHGPIANRWMEIAQCFAGPSEDPPAPGTRA